MEPTRFEELMPNTGTDQDLRDVIIVGAGPAGIGVAVVLREVGVEDILVLDRHEVRGVVSSVAP